MNWHELSDEEKARMDKAIIDSFDHEKKRLFKKHYLWTLKDTYEIYKYKFGAEGMCPFKQFFYYCFKHQRETDLFSIIDKLSGLNNNKQWMKQQE